MPKKEWSEEERKAFGAKMKAARAKNTMNTVEPAVEPAGEPVKSFHEVKPDPIVDNEDIKSLISRVKELETLLKTQPQQAPQQTPQVSAQGALVGTFEKYLVDPNHYPDPCKRLTEEPKLQRFAFPMNYELKFYIQDTSYQTIDGIRTREPRFNIELYRIVMDENTGEPTRGRWVVCRATFHEDPQAALTIAREQGVDISQWGEKQFLDEMRYLRIRDWLLEAFYPPKPSQDKVNKKEMVIGNRLVEYFEINSENSEEVPFSQLKGKI